MSNRAVAYLRSSKDRSDVSIDAQRRALHDVAATRNLVLVEEFADVVESGKDDDRAGFQRLLHAIKTPERGWEHVLVLDTSRIARRRLIALVFEQEAQRQGVKILYRNVPDSDPVTEMLLKSILQAMDEWHSLTSRQKGLAGMAENVRQGWRAGGRAPRGYRLEYHGTGAIRDGAPVLKSRLVVDDECAEGARAYLELRAAGIPRGAAIARLRLQWPASSVHSMDWQALTYAGHTVWNMHAERAGGKAIGGEKRRPRAEWVVNRNTHRALITDAEAEAILAQMERALHGRRTRESPLLFTGLLQTPEGQGWHSDGCGFYRAGKGRKVQAARLDAAVLELIAADLCSDDAVEHVRSAMAALAGGEPIDGRTLAGLEKRIATLTSQIGKTIDLAAQMQQPQPVLRRVEDLELQRSHLVDKLKRLREQWSCREQAVTIDAVQVRALLRRLFAEIADSSADAGRRAAAKQALCEAVERIDLDPADLSLRVHYAVQTGDMVASPRESHLTPVRWQSEVVWLTQRRRA